MSASPTTTDAFTERIVTAVREALSEPAAPPKLLDAEQTGEILGVPAPFVLELARRGELPSVKVGKKYVRFRPADITRWIEERSA